MSIQDAIQQTSEHRELLRMVRREASAEIDRLLRILDAIEGDPDLEPDTDAEPDQDGEPWLGSVNPTPHTSQLVWAAGGSDDREGDPLDRGEEEHDTR